MHSRPLFDVYAQAVDSPMFLPMVSGPSLECLYRTLSCEAHDLAVTRNRPFRYRSILPVPFYQNRTTSFQAGEPMPSQNPRILQEGQARISTGKPVAPKSRLRSRFRHVSKVVALGPLIFFAIGNVKITRQTLLFLHPQKRDEIDTLRHPFVSFPLMVSHPHGQDALVASNERRYFFPLVRPPPFPKSRPLRRWSIPVG